MKEIDMKEIEWMGGDDGPNRRGDVVFVHGLNGDALKTWTTFHNKEEICWPFWLAEDIPNIAVRALHYEASPSAWMGNAMDLNQRAINLLWLLQANGIGEHPICFIAHSMGGLIVKSMLRAAETSTTEYSAFIENTRSIVFFDTPHHGAMLATVFSQVPGLRKTAALDNLREHDPQLQELNKWYQIYVVRKKIENLVFYATKGLPKTVSDT
jgi:triacylglycerol esterase/lipase EstA (alpha/beta hydrolase family)